MRATPTPRGVTPRRTRRLAALASAALLTLAGCENLVARVDGGSETGVDNAEFGLRF